MKHKIHLLKWHRKRASFPKQDVAFLLGMDAANLTRYEKGNRNPTPEIILCYHILFGASLKQLFLPKYQEVRKQIQERSGELMDQLRFDSSPKSSQRIAYLKEIVNALNHENEYEQETK
jgi:transcriptional regulator with XRE-family HTH domain